MHASHSPAWEMTSFGQKGFAASFGGRSFDLNGPSLGMRGPCVNREALFEYRGLFVGFKWLSFELRGLFSVREVPVLA